MGPEGITRTNGEADVSPRVGRTSTAGAVQLWNQCLKKKKKREFFLAMEKFKERPDDFLFSNNLLIDYLPYVGHYAKCWRNPNVN